MAQRIFQDPAGAIPAILPDQPVGLVKRMAGTVDATQATALSKPTLARWPMSGARNLANGAQAVSNETYWPNTSGGSGVTATKIGVGVELDGVPYVDVRYTGTATATSMSGTFNSLNARQASQVGSLFTCSISAKIIAGSLPAGGG